MHLCGGWGGGGYVWCDPKVDDSLWNVMAIHNQIVSWSYLALCKAQLYQTWSVDRELQECYSNLTSM